MNQKQLVGIEAASYVSDGMIVGLGTGSTAFFMIEELGRRVREEHLHITGVTTSLQSKVQAQKLNIPLKSIDDVPYVDLTIDGADEISADHHGIKGGGAALLYEKIVATYSKEVIWIADESKLVEKLGKFPLPIEVIPYGSKQLLHFFAQKKMAPTLRQRQDGEILLTDSGHYIIDLHLGQIDDPKAFGHWLSQLTGVVEHGIFSDFVTKTIIAKGHHIITTDVKKEKN
ncbi:ribose-5-phosphate isomerase RpiA [Vagococcus entomophilus]|uniref:Ribose-5-phosphate isomerase A n=1 Tax=Vagococcus entomophilus TaxID=1160095 RepID=A0A430AG10_9ENTE|nr:ribose-5-phosphate isomerase RpiA [Vagococcus entomophilus]RSU06852.1 ribose 5-phosphate isomerase A [Vagococcus entomophilus]